MKRPRRQPPYRPAAASGRLYLRLPSRQVALLTFLLEARDNLALPTVVDRFAAVVRLLYAPQAAGEVEAFMRDFAVVCPEARVCLRPGPFPVAKAASLD
ncbi:MAG: DUF4911 domain-containing protein [Solidesulfovibrio sp.]|uniref:DUF4911 domain-containing protein n=1 Tax=Solidesulfovibrio sp. TaxID=2910990 RepID=UPI00315880ED